MRDKTKKAAIAAYKERKVTAGIYSVHCRPIGQTWIGRAPDLSTVQNRLWFTLRQLGYPQPAIQAAWRDFGEESFVFKVVEALEEDVSPLARDRILKERQAHWRVVLNADAL